MTKNPLIFISHASPDKPKLRFIIDRLLAERFCVFIDNPGLMGYGQAEIRRMERLHAGTRWPDALKDKVRAADCVLLCWSEAAAAGRAALADEIAWADFEDKLIVCLIEPCSREGLRVDLSTRHTARLHDASDASVRKTQLDLLIADIRAKIEADRSLARRGARAGGGHRQLELLPLLAGRQSQEGTVRSALDTAKLEGGVRPLVLGGPDNELPSRFIDRFARTGGTPDTAGRLSDGSAPVAEGPVSTAGRGGRRTTTIELFTIDDWPRGSAESFADEYRPQFSKVVAGGGHSDELLAAGLARKQRPILIYHTLRQADWMPDEPARIRAWIRFWTRIAQLEKSAQVVPLLGVVMPDSPPGWDPYPPPGWLSFRARRRNQRIWKSILALEAHSKTATDLAEIKTMRLLAPIKGNEADNWIRAVTPRLDRFGPGYLARARGEVESLYASLRAREQGINHSKFKQAVSRALTAS